ncbi:SRPBCC family protein, partial [Rhodopseudomonas sp. WA056]|nr:SRPBCC family protein [Rhodopseudomonas sp. WA056]
MSTTAATATSPFEIRHAVVIAAPPETVFDYVTNPR